MDVSKVMLLYYPISRAGCSQQPHYALIRIQFVNALVNKINITNLVHDKIITLYFFSINHKA